MLITLPGPGATRQPVPQAIDVEVVSTTAVASGNSAPDEPETTASIPDATVGPVSLEPPEPDAVAEPQSADDEAKAGAAEPWPAEPDAVAEEPATGEPAAGEPPTHEPPADAVTEGRAAEPEGTDPATEVRMAGPSGPTRSPSFPAAHPGACRQTCPPRRLRRRNLRMSPPSRMQPPTPATSRRQSRSSPRRPHHRLPGRSPRN